MGQDQITCKRSRDSDGAGEGGPGADESGEGGCEQGWRQEGEEKGSEKGWEDDESAYAGHFEGLCEEVGGCCWGGRVFVCLCGISEASGDGHGNGLRGFEMGLRR